MTALTVSTILKTLRAQYTETVDARDKACEVYRDEENAIYRRNVCIQPSDEQIRKEVTQLDSHIRWKKLDEQCDILAAAIEDFANHDFH